MAPLGVKVVTAVLGVVNTSENKPSKPSLELPTGSYYETIWDFIDRQKLGVVYSKKQNVDVAAKNVVDDVRSGRGPFIRRGYSSTLLGLQTPSCRMEFLCPC